MVEMELVGVRVELPTNAPIVLLRERAGQHRLLPIFIGGPEATAIAFALEGVETPRPMTHDLLKDILDDLHVRLERIVVTELRESTFFAEIHMTQNGSSHAVSSRPSDAIALAVRAGTPIFADEQVLDEAAYPPEEQPAENQDDVVEQFREFIEKVNPEDFAS
ncbi:MAG: bifunctional nuclease family protein [Acidimicrobiales bacterium]